MIYTVWELARYNLPDTADPQDLPDLPDLDRVAARWDPGFSAPEAKMTPKGPLWESFLI